MMTATVRKTLKQAYEIVRRDLNVTMNHYYAAIKKDPACRRLNKQIDALRRRLAKRERAIRKAVADPVEIKLNKLDALYNYANKQLAWAITPQERLTARGLAKEIMDRAEAIQKKDKQPYTPRRQRRAR